MHHKPFAGTHLAFAVLVAGLCALAPAYASEPADGNQQKTIHVDIPITLKQANVVFNMDHPANDMGDTPVGIGYMHQLAERYKKDGTKGRIIGVFHGAGAYLLLNDKAFDAFTHGSTGNPYKGAIAELLKQGVKVEECAVSMKANHWTNSDLLPGIKVNAGAVARIIELVQEGYVQLHY